jgi:hypothetical protein
MRPRHPLSPSLALFAAGSLSGPALDAFHAYNGILEYPHPEFLRMAWWVPFLFGGYTLLITLSAPLVDLLGGRWAGRVPSLKLVASGVAIFALVYMISGLWAADSSAKNMVFAVVSGWLWFFLDRSLLGLIYAAGTAFLGCAAEAFLVHNGHFHYHVADVFGIPTWIFFLHFNGALAVGNLGRIVFKSPA